MAEDRLRIRAQVIFVKQQRAFFSLDLAARSERISIRPASRDTNRSGVAVTR
jgi:hypothetical protein